MYMAYPMPEIDDAHSNHSCAHTWYTVGQKNRVFKRLVNTQYDKHLPNMSRISRNVIDLWELRVPVVLESEFAQKRSAVTIKETGMVFSLLDCTCTHANRSKQV